jgi:hypothetical protein
MKLVTPASILDQTMAPASFNGPQNGSPLPPRRLRFDDFVSTLIGKDRESRHFGPSRISELGQGHSGRRFVVVAVVVVLLTWGGLYLAFERWRAQYRERVAYGASHVVSAVDPLKEVTPPDVDPAVWRDTVDKTHAMLMTVVASNLLDRGDMDKLRVELDQFVTRARARPETAKNELAAIWNEMADRAEFLFQDSRAATQDRHARPKILPARPTKAAATATAKTTAKTNPAPPVQ